MTRNNCQKRKSTEKGQSNSNSSISLADPRIKEALREYDEPDGERRNVFMDLPREQSHFYIISFISQTPLPLIRFWHPPISLEGENDNEEFYRKSWMLVGRRSGVMH